MQIPVTHIEQVTRYIGLPLEVDAVLLAPVTVLIEQ